VLTSRGYVPVEELQATDRIATGQGLSALAFDVVCGTVLGDGCLQARSCCLTFSDSHRQLEYAKFKASLLSELTVETEEREVSAVAGGERGYQVVLVRTLAHRALRVLRADFYRPDKVVPEWLPGALNPRMLAFWFMDDGYTRIRPGARGALSEISANALSGADLQRLIGGLMRLGLPAKASRSRLYFDVSATERLSEIIAPFVPSPMRYKLHPDVEARVPFAEERLAHGATTVLYDEVEIEELAERTARDTTFFCLDVAETGNFVTAGGVVHNCRPPGNRDPQPIEIENCQDYLRRQVALIEPSVICTLGNFSTKLLRADPTGITRLHGQPEVLVVGRRAVRLYPIYHPAAALYTPRMLETLREDFARLPELLALGPPAQPEDLEAPEPLDQRSPAGSEAAPKPAEPTEGPPAAGAGSVRGTVEPAPEPDQLGLF
jgi:hypothetical protein